jgi:SpoVK/Ycf46/Vps4 family AAA+-type ATPase
MTTDDKEQALELLIRAKYPILYIVSAEERRVEELLREVAARRHKQLFSWTITEGVADISTLKPIVVDGGAREPLQVLEVIASSRDSAIFVLKDFHPFLDNARLLENAVVVRKLRDVVNHLKESPKTLVLLSPVLAYPPELEKDITVLDYSLPSADELAGALDRVLRSARSRGENGLALDEEETAQIIRAAQGLTCTEAENVFAKSLVMHRRLEVDVIIAEKQHLIQKSKVMEFFPAAEDFADVGGMNELKEWLRKRGQAFSERARRFGLPEPRGLLLLGVSGSGKSLIAKAVANQWHLPLLRLDMGRVFGELVGASEHNMRQALRLAENVSPAVVWLDELDKGLAGTASSGRSDAGTAARVFGTFLTWMQEKKTPVFTVATANDLAALPPETLRRGRFDEIFFVDLPTLAERQEIWAIHIRKRNRQLEHFDLSQLAAESEGFSGAEIEQVVIAGLYDAFDSGRDLDMSDLLHNIAQTVPLSQTMRDQVEALRRWGRRHARSAGGVVTAGTPTAIPERVT